MSSSNLSNPFSQLDQVSNYREGYALEFSYDPKNKTLNPKSSFWMTVRSALHFLSRWCSDDPEAVKTKADIEKNQNSIKALLQYIEDTSNEEVRAKVQKSTVWLQGDFSGEKYTVSDRIDRGTYVSRGFVEKLKYLAREELGKHERAQRDKAQADSVDTSAKATQSGAHRRASRFIGHRIATQGILQLPQQLLGKALSNTTSPDDTSDAGSSRTAGSDSTHIVYNDDASSRLASPLSQGSRGSQKRQSSSLGSNAGNQENGRRLGIDLQSGGALPPLRQEDDEDDSVCSNDTMLVNDASLDDGELDPQMIAAAIAHRGLKTAPILFSPVAGRKLPGLYDLMIKAALGKLSIIGEDVEVNVKSILEAQCSAMRMEEELRSLTVQRPSKVSYGSQVQQLGGKIQERLDSTVQNIEETVHQLNAPNRTVVDNCKRVAVEASSKVLHCLRNDIAGNGPFEQSAESVHRKHNRPSYGGFQQYVAAFIHLANVSQRYTAARIRMEDPQRVEGPNEEEYRTDLDELLSDANRMANTNTSIHQWTNTNWFDELAFGLGFLSAQEYAARQKNADVAEFGHRTQLSVDDVLLNEVELDQYVGSDEDDSISYRKKDDLGASGSIETMGKGLPASDSPGDAMYLYDTPDAGPWSLPYDTVRRCMKQAAVALSNDANKASHDVENAFDYSTRFDYEDRKLLLKQTDSFEKNDSDTGDSDTDQLRSLRPEFRNAYQELIPNLRATMCGIDHVFSGSNTSNTSIGSTNSRHESVDEPT